MKRWSLKVLEPNAVGYPGTFVGETPQEAFENMLCHYPTMRGRATLIDWLEIKK